MKNIETAPPATPEEYRAVLLEKINQILADLGSTGKWRKLPESFAEYEALRGKKIVMVDDVKMLLENFMPILMVATDGNASFVQYTGQAMDELIEQIARNNPDIVLMDYHLSEYFKGSGVVRALKEQKFSGQAIGFSSDARAAREFTAAGADGTVNKGAGLVEEAVKELADLIAKK